MGLVLEFEDFELEFDTFGREFVFLFNANSDFIKKIKQVSLYLLFKI
jgi:hypothetical protein